MKNVQNVKSDSRVIRVAPQAHHRLKVLAAEEDKTISQLATEALEAELARRQAATPPDRPQ